MGNKSKVKISAVSYFNTLPFIHGLQNSEVRNEINLELDIPSICAEKLLQKKVDLGLVPVAILPKLKEHYIVSDYCIGAKGKVNSVFLLSDVPLNEIRTVFLDYQSKTSVNLVRVLAKKYWHISPSWLNGGKGFETKIKGPVAGVVIGDRTFSLTKEYGYCYDLSEEWHKFTGLPFVFACWVSNKKLPTTFLGHFNAALKLGVENVQEVIDTKANQTVPSPKLKRYLTQDIDYRLGEKEKEAMNLFLDYAKEIE